MKPDREVKIKELGVFFGHSRSQCTDIHHLAEVDRVRRYLAIAQQAIVDSIDNVHIEAVTEGAGDELSSLRKVQISIDTLEHSNGSVACCSYGARIGARVHEL